MQQFISFIGSFISAFFSQIVENIPQQFAVNPIPTLVILLYVTIYTVGFIVRFINRRNYKFPLLSLSILIGLLVLLRYIPLQNGEVSDVVLCCSWMLILYSPASCVMVPESFEMRSDFSSRKERKERKIVCQQFWSHAEYKRQ